MNRDQVAAHIKMLKQDTDHKPTNDLGEVLAYLFNRVNAMPRTTLTYNEILALSAAKEVVLGEGNRDFTWHSDGSISVDIDNGHTILSYASLEEFLMEGV